MPKAYSVTGTGHDYNQDNWVILEKGVVHACVVCDGHGDSGHIISGAVCPEVARKLLASTLSTGGRLDSPASAEAIRSALIQLDNMVRKKLSKASRDSGCTVAGFLLDTRTQTGLAFSVGDSLVFVRETPESRPKMLHLQNADNAPQSMLEAADRYQWKTKKALIGIPGEKTRYMMAPGTDEGLQLYSTMGDFNLKRVNPLVGTFPQVMRFAAVPGETCIIVTSDGYTDGLKHKPLSADWADSITREMEASEMDARELVNMARDRKSTDDITVIAYRYE